LQKIKNLTTGAGNSKQGLQVYIFLDA